MQENKWLFFFLTQFSDIYSPYTYRCAHLSFVPLLRLHKAKYYQKAISEPCCMILIMKTMLLEKIPITKSVYLVPMGISFSFVSTAVPASCVQCLLLWLISYFGMVDCRDVRKTENSFGFGCKITELSKKFDIRPDGFTTETACNPQFKLKVTKNNLFNVQIKNLL